MSVAGRLNRLGVLQTGQVTYSFNHTDHVTDHVTCQSSEHVTDHVVKLQARHMSVSDVSDVVTIHRTRELSACTLTNSNLS